MSRILPLVLKPKEMQEVDRIAIEERKIPSFELMRNAGYGVFKEIVKRIDLSRKKVTLVCGKGNNGGDGFVVAYYLTQKTPRVHAFLLGKRDELRGDAKRALELFESTGNSAIEITDLEQFKNHQEDIINTHVLIDAIFGTGFRGELDPFTKEVIEIMNKSKAFLKVSVDIPSGVDGETGEVKPISFMANLTVTFQYRKTGHLLFPGRVFTGELVVRDIGIPEDIAYEKFKRFLLTKDSVKTFFRKRIGNENKGDFGRVLVVAGSKGYTGAAMLTSISVYKIGAGLVYLLTPNSLNPIYETSLPEVITIPFEDHNKAHLTENAIKTLGETNLRFDVIAIGPGISRKEEVKEVILNLMEKFKEIPIVLDADGFVLYFEEMVKLGKKLEKTLVVTPHPGEMGRVLGLNPDYVDKYRIDISQEFSEKYNVITVLKGNPTVISSPNGEIYINTLGNPGLAKGGTGDVLTGFITGLLAQKLTPLQASLLGVYLHALSGDLAREKLTEYTILARDLLEFLPQAIKLTLEND